MFTFSRNVCVPGGYPGYCIILFEPPKLIIPVHMHTTRVRGFGSISVTRDIWHSIKGSTPSHSPTAGFYTPLCRDFEMMSSGRRQYMRTN